MIDKKLLSILVCPVTKAPLEYDRDKNELVCKASGLAYPVRDGVKEPDGGRRPINAKSETVSRLPSFRAAYAKRRCIVPIANFFEWRKTTPPKQPYAIAMKDGSPFGLAGIWENWKHPVTDNYIRSFCILTCPANEMIAAIHDRMPVILPPDAYDRWLSDLEPDPGDLLVPYPAGAMRMWPISTRVNAPRNDDPSILDPLED
jgi:putative SOS response-associated peptidase YedK